VTRTVTALINSRERRGNRGEDLSAWAGADTPLLGLAADTGAVGPGAAGEDAVGPGVLDPDALKKLTLAR
jgi:hypothetical protein